MARKKRAWNMSNPLYRYIHGGKKATKTRTRRRKTGGSFMSRRRGGRRAFGGGGNTFIRDMLVGMGAAAATKRFIGAPLGQFTGVAAGAGTTFITKGNLLAAAAGGAIHDFVGNVGGNGSTGGYLQ